MKIDIFNHFFPERFFDEFINVGSGGGSALKRVQNVQTLTDLDARFRLMDEFGELRQVLSLAHPRSRCWQRPVSRRIWPEWAMTDWPSWSPSIPTVSPPS